MTRAAVLALEDCTAWWGEAFGDASAASGEVVFNTAMTGYQEIASDASYNGQIVVLTYPLIGSYGTFERATESRRPWVEALVVRELETTCREDTLDLDDPEVAAAVDDFIRKYETKWLDEPIPALDGHTPRRAADDPTRRGDLIKLLDTFPAGDAARGGMDADRLRAALGLR